LMPGDKGVPEAAKPAGVITSFLAIVSSYLRE
jgi:hypothetical protein